MKASGISLCWTCGFTVGAGLCWQVLHPLAFALGTCACICFMACMFTAFQGD